MDAIARIIKIIELPHGDAPEWVRRGWIGCEIPCKGLECGHIPVYVHSVVPRLTRGPLTVPEFLALPKEQKIDGYTVNQADALMALEAHNPAAAKWWKDHGFPKKGKGKDGFRFKLSEVKVVEAYTEEELMKLGVTLNRYDDMERGTTRPVDQK
ncbi:MAG: hypothetical protein JWL87_207 [Candidatus Adlerbacteria bacterium]|nr:hypothetical protein [Candidatus Adlerbacteria bacterium]